MTQPGFSFGTPTASNVPPQLGTGTNFSFGGGTQAAAPAPLGGNAPGTGFSFGGTQAVTTSAPTALGTGTGFSFGGGAQAPAGAAAPPPLGGTGFSFGGGTQAQAQVRAPAPLGTATGFSFGGATTAATTSAPATGFSFGGATAAATTTAPTLGGTGTSFSFGGGGGTAAPATTSAPATLGISFGGLTAPATTTTVPTLGAGTNFSFGGAGAPTTTTAAPATLGSGFSFGGTTTTTSAPAPSLGTGFSFGGGTQTTSGATAPQLGAGFSFGGGAAPHGTSAPSNFAGASTTTLPGSAQTVQGLGGIPSARISTLALGGDAGSGWSTRNDNRAVQEMLVPPEILAVVEDLKNHIRNHKAAMAEVNRLSEQNLDTVSEQIEEVRLAVNSLSNLMHKQEVHSAALMRDMQEITKDIDLLCQVRDAPPYDTTAATLTTNYLFNLADKYTERLNLYKTEFERAEFSFATLIGGQGPSVSDLWNTLTATKDAVIVLSSKIHQLQEEIRHTLTAHKSISQVIYASTPKHWLTAALAGGLESKGATPLEKVWSNTPIAKPVSSSTTLETLFQRPTSMFNRAPPLVDNRAFQAASSDALLRTPHPSSHLGMPSFSPSFNPSAMGSFMGPTTPLAAASLKRSKK